MGAPSAQVQSPQSSTPASKGAGVSPSTPSGSGKSATMAATSGQPTMGQPNTNGNTGLAPISSGYIAPTDGNTAGLPNSYPNTTSQWDNQATKTPAGLGKGA
jgi:hypothetical protein